MSAVATHAAEATATRHGGPWGDEEIERLLELRKLRKRIVDIARELNCDPRRVHAKITKLEGQRGTNHPKAMAPQERAERRCLCCGGKFPSVSRFNRLCEPCGGFAGALPW